MLPTKITASPSTSVLAIKLAHTGGDGVAGALVLSLALLGLGGILLVAGQTLPGSLPAAPLREGLRVART